MQDSWTTVAKEPAKEKSNDRRETKIPAICFDYSIFLGFVVSSG